MKIIPSCLTLILLLLAGPVLFAQTEDLEYSAKAPPKLLLLVHQQFKPGAAAQWEKIQVAIARACNHLDVPNSWIDLQSLTGPPEALSFDPFDSFAQLDTAVPGWARFFAAHPEIARLQEQVPALVASDRTVIAVRRDDLGYRPNTIDLSKARYMRVLEVHLRPGHENDFVEAFKILSAAYEKIDSDTPSVVYQVNVGSPSPAFLAFVPMQALRQNDDLLARAPKLREAEGEDGTQRMQQIASDAYLSTESNLYAVKPAMSRVSREFAAGDPDFWSPSVAANPPANKTPAKQSQKKDAPNR